MASLGSILLARASAKMVRAQVMEAGASGYVFKTATLDALPEVVRRAARGEDLVEPEERARLARVLRHRRHQDSTERQRANRLTPRQTQILQMLSDGMGPKEIARRLEMSPLTLRTHVQNILMRLGVHSKVEAVAVAMRQGKVRSL